MDGLGNFAFMLPTTMATFGGVFLVIGWLGTRSARAWGVAFLFGAVGFLAPVLPVPITLQSLFGNAVFLVSFYFYGEALLRHFRRPLLAAPRLIFALLAYGAIIIAVVGLESLQAELLLSDIATALLLGVPVLLVVRRARSLIDRTLVTVAAIVVTDILVRLLIFNVLVGISNDLADFAQSSYTFYMQVSVSVLSFGFALSALGAETASILLRYQHAAERDPLTGLFNRRGFDVATLAFSPAERLEGVIMVCDIDHFKQVNDSFGHASGDGVLAGLADLLLSRLPPNAVISRFGGEEFVVFLPDMRLADAAALAQLVRVDFAAKDWRPSGVLRQITMSIGVAAPTGGDTSLHDTLSRADRALYAAKSGGRNGVMIDAGDAYVAGLRVVPAA